MEQQPQTRVTTSCEPAIESSNETVVVVTTNNNKRLHFGEGYRTVDVEQLEILQIEQEFTDDEEELNEISKEIDNIQKDFTHNDRVREKRAKFNAKKKEYARCARIRRSRASREAYVPPVEPDNNPDYEKIARKDKYTKVMRKKWFYRTRDYQRWARESAAQFNYRAPEFHYVPPQYTVPPQPEVRYAEQASIMEDFCFNMFSDREFARQNNFAIRLSDCQMKTFESIVLLITNLCQTHTWTHFTTILLAYVHNNFDVSFSKGLALMIEKSLEEMIPEDREQSAEYVHKAATTLLNCWNTVAHGETALKLKRLIAMLIAGGACYLTKMPFTGELFTRFYQSSGIDKVSGADIITQVLETAIFFWERGMSFFATGDVRALFSSHTLANDYDIEFAFLSARINFIKNGDIKNAGLTEAEYHDRVEKLYQRGVDFLRVYKGPERKILTDKISRTEVLRAELLDVMNRINIKEQPFAILVYGGSSEGKSTISSLLTSDCLKAMGYPSRKENICSLNPSDKFQTEYRPEHHGLKLDDMGNVKSEFVEVSPLEILRKVCNNEPCFALKADVGEKGKILFRPKVVLVTTNIKNLDSHVYSREPISAMRRFNYILTMSIRKEYRNDNNLGLNFAKTKNILGDFWTYKVQIANPIRTNPELLDRSMQPPDAVGFKTVEHNGALLEAISLEELLLFLREKSAEHRARQTELVDVLTKLDEQEDCPHGMYIQLCSRCQLDDAEQSDVAHEIVAKAYHSIPTVCRSVLHWMPSWSVVSPINALCNALVNPIKSFATYSVCAVLIALIASVPVCCVLNKIMPLCCSYIVSVCVFIFVSMSLVKARFMRMCSEVARAPFKLICGEVQHRFYKGAFAVLAASMAVVYAFYRVYKTCNMVKMSTQSAEMKIPEKDENPRVNVWKKVHVSNPEVDPRVSTATLDQMVTMLSNKIAHISFYDEEKGVRCNAFPLGRNCWMAPYHIMKREHTHMRFVLVDPDKIGPNFTARIDSSLVYKIPGKDMCVFYVPAGGSQADLTHLFPEDYTQRAIGVTSIYKNATGEVSLDKFRATPSMRVHEDDDPRVMTYKMTEQTFSGLCTMPLLAMGKTPYIVGFHVGGYQLAEGVAHTAHTKEECKRGFACMLTKKEVISAMEHLYDNCPMALRVANAGDMKLESVDHNIALKGYVHDKSPLSFMEQGDLTAYGAHTGMRRRFTSQCVKSVISDAVEKELGAPNIWGGPKNMGNTRPWHAELECYMAQQDVNPKYANMAFVDLSTTLTQFLQTHDDLKDRVHPIPIEVALAGATEVYGIDSMNMNTSTGWPLNKRKKDVLNFDLPPHDRIGRPAALPANLEREVDECIAQLRNRKRTYNVFRGNLKDEPTKVDKEKVRVFAGSPIVLTVIIRMYFLMISKFIMENPIAFESAVGLNCHGPEWDELVKHFTKHGYDRLIAGDFKAFDSMVCAMMTIMAFKICILVAVWAGFEPEDITLMESIATEVVYAVIEMNGDFVCPNGSNPSGHPLTVIINCIVGMLYFRCVYYEEAHRLGVKSLPLFNQVVAFMSYGDDNVMSVKAGYDWFNHTTIQKVLGQYGVQYTMADKTSESRPFISIEECEFLKRTPIYNEEVGLWWGPLHEQSIVKSLHCNIMSEVLSPGEHAAECIEGAMTEYFFHGEEVYNDRAQKLKRVVAQCGIEPHLDDGVFQPYRLRMKKYKEKYGLVDKEQADEFDIYMPDELMEAVSRTHTAVMDQVNVDAAEEAEEWLTAHAAHHARMALVHMQWLDQYSSYHDVNDQREMAYHLQHARWFRDRGEEYPWEWDHPPLVNSDTESEYSDIHSFGDDDIGSVGGDTEHLSAFDTDSEVDVMRRRGYADCIVQLCDAEWQKEEEIRKRVELAYWRGVHSSVVKEVKRTVGRWEATQTVRSTPAESLNVQAGSWIRDNWMCRRLHQLFALILLMMCFTSTVSYTHPVIRTVGEYDRIATTQQTYRMDVTSGVQQHQNLVFRDGEDNWQVSIPSSMDATRNVGMTDDVTLAEFMARPVNIASYQWTVGTPLNVAFDPWSLFFGQKRVNNRINNFSLMHAELHVKVVINGTKFHFGRAMMDYAPLPSFNFVDDFSFTEPNLVQASQRMHITLDPTESQGGDMILPFIWHYNALNVQQAEWSKLGSLYLREIVGLGQANGGTTPVTISVYAWAESIHLSIPTTENNISITPQADEYSKTPVSDVATAVSKAAGRLTSIPMIGQYARATEMITGAMGKMAKAYGFSRPAVIDDVTDMIPNYYAPMANTDRGDNTTKLTVDSKQELTVDPAVTGAATGDELTVANIATKQSYLTTYSWTIANPIGTLLWNTQVGPLYMRAQPAGTYSVPAMSFAALPFMWWRGTIRYRFQIVASAFHRGRLRIVYDPNSIASQDNNVAYTRIIDLANERDFTIDVAWSQPKTFLRSPPLNTAFMNAFGPTIAVAKDVVFKNGVLAVYVLNDLVAPIDTGNDIQIITYVSFCDDVEFAVPSDNNLKLLTYKDQGDEFDTANAPLDLESKECVAACLDNDSTMLVYMGESIPSFRTLLKRYNRQATFRNNSATAGEWVIQQPNFPPSPGAYLTGINVTATVPAAGTIVNFTNMTLLNYLAPAFLMTRGGLRAKYAYSIYGTRSIVNPELARLDDRELGAPEAQNNGTTATNNTNASTFAQARLAQYLTTGMQGFTLSYIAGQPVISAEFPYYSNRRFDSAKNPGFITSTITPSGSHRLNVTTDAGANLAFCDKFIATGEDFNLILFQGAPRLKVRTFT